MSRYLSIDTAVNEGQTKGNGPRRLVGQAPQEASGPEATCARAGTDVAPERPRQHGQTNATLVRTRKKGFRAIVPIALSLLFLAQVIMSSIVISGVSNLPSETGAGPPTLLLTAKGMICSCTGVRNQNLTGNLAFLW